MAAPPSSRLQTMLQTAVQSVHWTYSLFWQLCPQQGILIWADGYYNGPIKTRKTVQPMEVSAEETSLQRSQQLRELYDSLSAGETNQPARRPSAALSPEDLTETEWFYLMCVSFAFPPGLGVPGKAYAKRRHVWLTGANEADSKVFTRAILAKSARIQTVLCIPLLGGVVELGTTARVQEDVGLIQRVKSFFTDVQNPQPPKPAISEQSTSNPATSSGHPPFQSPIIPDTYSTPDPVTQMDEEDIDDHDDDDDEEEEEEEEEGGGESDPESEMDRNGAPNIQAVTQVVAAAEPSELAQLEMSEDIRIGSPEDGSNNLESDFHMLQVNQAGNTADPQAELYMAESARGWPHLQEPMDDDAGGSLQTPISSMIGGPPLDDQLHQEDSHYSQTVSTILHYQSSRWSDSSAAGAGAYVGYSTHSAFTNWATTSSDHHNHHYPAEGTSQWLLKYILFTVPYLHAKCRGGDELVSRIRKGTPQEELSANHVLAERRRREKLNERFIILRSLVPFVTKMDKASILGDTIEYVKQLRKKIQDLETKTRQMEIDHQRPKPAIGVTAAADKARSTTDKRKIRIVEVNGGGVKPKAVVESLPAGEAAQVEVSIIESDALVELRCPHRDGLLLDVMQVLRELGVEITTVQSSLISGTLVAELRAKVKENINGRRASIMEVKRAINHIIRLC